MKRVLFLLGTASLLALFVGSCVQDLYLREWNHYQRVFLGRLRKDERRGITPGVKQLIVSDLKRVDRCTTCHLAIDQPQLELGVQPFKAHPGGYLQWHPPERFGCTVCHEGQGLATEANAAHGEVKHWEKPLLRGTLVQASCAKCHGNLETIGEHVPRLLEGLALYKQLGCAGCHAVHGFGQTVSIDLSDMGDKPWQLLDFTFVEGHHTLSQWIYEHFKEPRKVTPGFRKEELPPGEEEVYPTFMPNYGLTDTQAWALTIYMLSLTAENIPAKYVMPPAPPKPKPVSESMVDAGRAVFEQYGCIGCHGQGGRGGRKNFNAQLGEEVPALVSVKAYYDRESLKEFIRAGRQPVPRANPARPAPALYMPAWKDRVSEQELDYLVGYLFSLSQLPEDTSKPAEQSPASHETAGSVTP